MRRHINVIIYLFPLAIFRCGAADNSECTDSDETCTRWATEGECQSNAIWMMANCRRSCHSCQGGDKAWRLRQKIAATYDNATSANVSRTVSVESVRINHVEMDEVNQNVRIAGRMVLSWNDSKIAWSRDEWGVSWLNFYWVQIWTPTVIQLNAPSTAPATVKNKVLAANFTGQVYLWTDFTFNAPYHFQYEDYPNDYQRICFKFDDKRYLFVRFAVAEQVNSLQRKELTETHTTGWTVSSFDVQESKYTAQVLGDWKRDPFDVETSNCELCVGMRRNAVYYMSEMLIPALVTSVLTVSAPLFQLSTVQSALVAFSIVSQILSLSLINSRLPAFASHTPTILKYAGFNMVMSGMLFLISLMLRRVAQSDSVIPPPHNVERFFELINRFLPVPASGKDAPDSKDGKYSSLSQAVNNLIFVVTLLIYLIAIVCSFMI